MSDNKKQFVRCTICGKTLLERQHNGFWRFMFGREKPSGRIPVDIIIYGSVKMRCIRRDCRKTNPEHWNIFNIFPHQNEFEQSPV